MKFNPQLKISPTTIIAMVLTKQLRGLCSYFNFVRVEVNEHTYKSLDKSAAPVTVKMVEILSTGL